MRTQTFGMQMRLIGTVIFTILALLIIYNYPIYKPSRPFHMVWVKNTVQAQVTVIKNEIKSEPVKNEIKIPPGQMSIMGKPTITIDKIEQVLNQYNSPAKGVGKYMYDTGLKYGINPAVALAFFVHESSAGTAGKAKTTKSIGNIRWTQNCGFDQFQGFRLYPNWESGIDDWYKLIKNTYVDSWKLNTVELVIPKYAPNADNNNETAYINAVKSLIIKWQS
jgi:hypothetical protein